MSADKTAESSDDVCLDGDEVTADPGDGAAGRATETHMGPHELPLCLVIR
jgi:hypothetical protein